MQNWQKKIDKLNTIAQKESVDQRQTYKRVSKQLLRDTHNANHPKRAKKAKKAARKLNTIAGRLLRELERKLDEVQSAKYAQDLEKYLKILNQKKKR